MITAFYIYLVLCAVAGVHAFVGSTADPDHKYDKGWWLMMFMRTCPIVNIFTFMVLVFAFFVR